MRMQLCKRSLIIGWSLLVGAGISNVFADDTELYVRSMDESSDVRPQVLIVFDTSGSMATSMTTKKPFDDYSKSYTKIYWSTDGTVPSSTSTNYFLAKLNNCKASIASLAEVGKYTDVVMQWNADSAVKQWQSLNTATSTSAVDCYADLKSAGTTTAYNPGTSVTGFPGSGSAGPYTSNTSEKSSVFASSSSVSLFTDAYVTWYHSAPSVNSTRLEVGKNAIKDLVYANPNVDFGLAIFNINGSAGSGTTDGSNATNWSGARIVKGIQQMTDARRTEFVNVVDSMVANASTPLTQSLYEASLYWAGRAQVPGKHQYGIFKGYTYKSGRYTYRYTATPVFDSTVFTNGGTSNDTYISPFKREGCNDTSYVIFITDGEPNGDTSADEFVRTEYVNTFTVGMSAADKTTYSTKISGSYLAQVAYYMYHQDVNASLSGTQNVSTYTIGFGEDAVNSAGVLLTKTAQWGGGKYYPASDSDALSTSLRKLINDILNRQYSGVTPSVSVNMQDRSENMDRLYYPVFLPKKGPFWPGNIKKLKLKDNLYIADSNNKPAIDTDGRIVSTAKTFWSSVVDGSTVTRGGVQEALSKQTTRSLWTNNGSTLVQLNKTNLLAMNSNNTSTLSSYLGLSSSTGLDDQISWIQGVDVDKTNSDTSLTNRELLLSDMMHSKPVTINYGGDTADVRLLVGSNAGFIHFFKDNDSSNSVSESWAYIPYSLLPAQKTLRDNVDGHAHVYGMDSTAVTYVQDVNSDGKLSSADKDKVWAFMGQRQGGRGLYALDLTSPDSPKLMWSILGGSGSFTRLGQTWSTPQVTKIPGYSKPVLIFGGGYDAGKDALALGTGDSVGNAIYIVDAETGALKFAVTPDASVGANSLQMTDMKDGIAAPVKIVDYDADGYVDHLYAVDTGGNLWRMDFPDSNTSHWKMYKMASLGSDTLRKDDRRFFGQPIVVAFTGQEVTKSTKNGKSSYSYYNTSLYGVLFGSGDRNHPRTDQTVVNDYFMIRDYQKAPYTATDTRPTTYTIDDLYDVSDNAYGQASTTEAQLNIQAGISSKKGWRYQLTGTGEKVFGSGLVSNYKVYFSTYLPEATTSANQCSVGDSIGTTRVYVLDLSTGSYDSSSTAYTSYNDTIIEDLGYIVDGNKNVRLLGPGPGGSALTVSNDGTYTSSGSGTGKSTCTQAPCDAGQTIGSTKPTQFSLYQAQQD